MTIRTRLRRLEASVGRRHPAPQAVQEVLDDIPRAAYDAFHAAIPDAGPVPKDPPPGLDPRLHILWPYAEVLRTAEQGMRAHFASRSTSDSTPTAAYSAGVTRGLTAPEGKG
jgi:hypothetical protein